MKKGFFDQSHSEWIVSIPDKQGKLLNLQKGKIHTARDKYDDKKKKQFTVEKLVWAQQSNNPEKIILLEELVWSDKRTELRLGYYTTDRYGRWAWGQFALMIPKNDFEELLTFAQEKQIL